MDLGAYINIENLDAVAEANGIYVPRLRGYRLMANEKFITKDEMKRAMEEEDVFVCCSLIQADWHINSYAWELSARTDANIKKYMVCGEGGTYIPDEIRWDKIHGKKRKNLKYELKNKHRRIKKQLDTFNKYAGKDDVLMIHARIGGDNWEYFEGNTEVATQPWFLEKIDDAYDDTYCDIYAKINLEKVLDK